MRAVLEHVTGSTFVFRSDVKGYYEAIDHECLMDQLEQLIHDPMVLKLRHGYMKHLEDAMEKTGLFYARFMDDWVVLSPERWTLRKAIKVANQVLKQLKVEKAS